MEPTPAPDRALSLRNDTGPGAVPLAAALAVYLDTLNSPHTRHTSP